MEDHVIAGKLGMKKKSLTRHRRRKRVVEAHSREELPSFSTKSSLVLLDGKWDAKQSMESRESQVGVRLDSRLGHRCLIPNALSGLSPASRRQMD